MVRPIPGYVSGEMVRVALMEARPVGLTLRQLVAATDLSPAQAHKGLAYIRAVGAAEHQTPLTYQPKVGYMFSDEPADWIAYERAQIHAVLTRLRSMSTGTADPHRERQPVDGSPGDDWIGLVLQQIGGVEASLKMLVKLRV